MGELLRKPLKSCGFTLVELVMVIILIGVLSALGIGLFTRSSAFSPLLATQQLQSATLLAQQAALAGNPSKQVKFSRDSDELKLEVGEVGEIGSFAIDLKGAKVGYRTSEGASFNTLGSHSIKFDKKGWVDNPGVGRETTEFRISGDSGSTAFYICVSSLGAVYQVPGEGGCHG